jgi:threonyl-tRNA synthetase
MDLFHLQAEAHGSVFWHPNGFVIYRALEAYMRRQIDAAGYREIKTPQLMDARQWEKSGHWGKYRENMFVVPDEIPSTDEDAPILSGDADLMALKPMNCPGHILVFKQGITSYKELPIRLARPIDSPVVSTQPDPRFSLSALCRPASTQAAAVDSLAPACTKRRNDQALLMNFSLSCD